VGSAKKVGEIFGLAQQGPCVEWLRAGIEMRAGKRTIQPGGEFSRGYIKKEKDWKAWMRGPEDREAQTGVTEYQIGAGKTCAGGGGEGKKRLKKLAIRTKCLESGGGGCFWVVGKVGI